MSERGPSEHHLRNLRSLLPSFIQQVEETKATTGRKTRYESKPRKVCRICCRLFDYEMSKIVAAVPLIPGECEPCAKLLKAGCKALVCQDRFAFVESPELADFEPVTMVSPHVMDAIERRFKGASQPKLNPITDLTLRQMLHGKDNEEPPPAA